MPRPLNTPLPTTPTYSPVPHAPATAGTQSAPAWRYAQYAEPHPVQPLKGLRITRTASVSYHALSAYGESLPFRITATHPVVSQSIMNYESCIMHCYTFSAKEKDSETGLSYFGSRYYSSDLSVWLSVDPMSDKYPSLSPYVYCANNPVRVVDPNGEEVWFPDDPPKKNVLTSVKNTIQKVGAQIEAGLHQLDLKVTGTAENRFCEGNSDGANQGTITKRDVEVGMAIVATMVTAGAAIEAEGAGSAIISTAAAVNDIDDATVNTTGQTFSQRKTENKPIANAAVNVAKTATPAASIGSSTMTIVKNGVKKASACMADVALSTYSFFKSLIHNKKSNVKP